MQSIKTAKGQTLRDMAVQLYGNVDAVSELLRLNNMTGKMQQDEELDADDIDLAAPIVQGTEIIYNETSPLIDKKELKELQASVRNEPNQTKTLTIATGDPLTE